MNNIEGLKLMIEEFKEKRKLYKECWIDDEDIEILENLLKERQADKDRIKELEEENNFLKFMYRETDEFKAIEQFANKGEK